MRFIIRFFDAKLDLNLAKMNVKSNLSKFAKYAWFVLVYNLLVILWGAFLRASLSGDGCGQHWLTCNGEIIPNAPQFKTIIEFSHRASTGLAFIFVLILFIRAVFKYGNFERKNSFASFLLKVISQIAKTFVSLRKNNSILNMAIASFIFIIAEALIGAGLVLTGNTAENLTPTRPFWMAAHLITTFSLLAALTLTAWFASGGKSFSFAVPRKSLILLAVAVLGFIFVGMSGSVAALSSMLFPSATLSEGLAKDFSASSNILLRLRVSHPILSTSVGVYLIFLAGWLKSQIKNNFWINRFANLLTIIILIQFAAGTLTFLLLAPLMMQIIHLFLADLLWIIFVLLAVNVLVRENNSTEIIE
ncbi:MAG: COX15/CtaA family protein [Pyrinomonadaceae bacterium]